MNEGNTEGENGVCLVISVPVILNSDLGRSRRGAVWWAAAEFLLRAAAGPAASWAPNADRRQPDSPTHPALPAADRQPVSREETFVLLLMKD